MFRTKCVALVVTAATLTIGLAATATPAAALACSAGASCDAYSVNLGARRNAIAANAPAWATLNKQAADMNAARGNNLGAYFYNLATSAYFTAAGDMNGNGSRDIDEALLFLTAYSQQANRSSAQALSFLQSAETIVVAAEAQMSLGGSYNVQATQVTNTWTAKLASPFGGIDRVEPTYNFLTGRFDRLSVQGWAIDPDSLGATYVDIYVGPTYPAPVAATPLANQSRPDVGGAYPPYGNNHGFSTLVPWTGGTSATACVTARNISTGQNQSLGCKTVAVNNTWQRTNLHTTLYGQSIHDMVGGFINPAASTAVRCDSMPTGFRPPPSLPAGVPKYYDCRRAGTVNRSKAQTYMNVLFSSSFVWDAGTGSDVYKTPYRVDMVSSTGSFGDPTLADTDNAQPNLPTTMAGAWGAVDLLTRYTNATTIIHRVNTFRQMYGVDDSGKVWAWKKPVSVTCYRESITIYAGVIPWVTSHPTTCP